MPNIKSQKDRVVQSQKEAERNKSIKTNLKTVVKKADAAIDSNAADKDATIKVAVRTIDSARAKGVIHKNTAARKISRMAKRNNKTAAK
jgi:small subunit ribosomal protein S20